MKVHFFHSLNDFPTVGDCIWLNNGTELSTITEFQLEHRQFSSSQPIITLTGINNRDEADKLRGAQIFASRSSLPEPEGESFYLFEVIGCRVFSTDNTFIGEVQDVLELPAQEVLIVDYQGKDVMIPLVDVFIKLIDIENRQVTIEPMEGLLDL